MLTLVLALCGIGLLLWRAPQLRHTTLIGPLAWAIAAFATLALAGLAEWLGPEQTRAVTTFQFVAACGTLCPLMSVMGAKRPQDRAWHFVVLSLWIVLALPAAEAWFLGSGDLDVRGARSWFFAILIVLGMLNYLPTRLATSSLMVAAGQLVLLQPYLPWLADGNARFPWWLGTALLLAALVIGQRTPSPPAAEKDRVWLDFRDMFGAFWALRVMQRLNHTAERNDWPVRVHWYGFQNAAGGPWRDALPPTLQKALRNLLRRFVSDAWIAARTDQTLD